MSDIYQQLKKELGDDLKTDFILAPYTTFKMGGAAEFYLDVTSEEQMVKAYKTSQAFHIPFTLIGGASNIVISDSGIKGLVVRNSISGKKIIEENDVFVLLKVGSGYSITRLAKETADLGWSGIEYHMGLPGTIGGAVAMNSKWTHPKAYVGDFVYEATLMTKDGSLKKVNQSYFEFAYGYSIIQKTKEIITSVVLKLYKKNSDVTRQSSLEASEYRKATQPPTLNTCGCFFKNPGNQSAGYLIDQCGLKGFQYKGFTVSEKHANFIINTGNGTSDDLRKLLEIIKEKVKKQFDIELEEEVLIIN